MSHAEKELHRIQQVIGEGGLRDGIAFVAPSIITGMGAVINRVENFLTLRQEQRLLIAKMKAREALKPYTDADLVDDIAFPEVVSAKETPALDLLPDFDKQNGDKLRLPQISLQLPLLQKRSFEKPDTNNTDLLMSYDPEGKNTNAALPKNLSSTSTKKMP